MSFITIFLLTPLREGRRDSGVTAQLVGNISTHAPAGGATAQNPPGLRLHVISTHAPAGGATSSAAGSLQRSWRFLLTPLREGRLEDGQKKLAPNPFLLTPLREGRLGLYRWDEKSEVISTHAPAGGATIRARLRRTRFANFYSRPCGRGDMLLASRRIPATHDFYSRPCGRGDRRCNSERFHTGFLLTPLREGRLSATSAGL